MTCAILWDDLSRTSTLSGSATVQNLSWSMLVDPQPRHRVRVIGSSASLTINFGSTKVIRAACLISTNLTSAAQVRLQAGSYDSGSETSTTGSAWNGNVIHVFPLNVSTSSLTWTIYDGSNDTIDIGLAPCGPLFIPTINHAYGYEWGGIDGGIRDLNQSTGTEYCKTGAFRRTASPRFDSVSGSESYGDWEQMDRIVMSTGDVLWIPDIDASRINLAARCIWGGFKQARARDMLTQNSFNRAGRSFTITERL